MNIILSFATFLYRNNCNKLSQNLVLNSVFMHIAFYDDYSNCVSNVS